MSCKKCKNPFSVQKGHQPRILIQCGHSQCENCIEACFKKSKIVCEECGQQSQGNNFNFFPINETLLAMINQGQTSVSVTNSEPEIKQLCAIHGQKLEAYCQKDNQLLCLSCVIGSQHKSHKISPVIDKVQKDRNILKDCYKKIGISKQQIEQINQIYEEELDVLAQDYKDCIFEIGISYSKVRDVLKETQRKCLQKCKSEYESAVNKIDSYRSDLQEKHQFYCNLQKIYEEIIELPALKYLHEDAKRIFIVENCKFKKPKSSQLSQFFVQNKVKFSKLSALQQINNSILQIIAYEKKIQAQNQGTPSTKSKKTNRNSNSHNNREPTVLQVNLSEQYKKFTKNTDPLPATFTKLKPTCSSRENAKHNNSVNPNHKQSLNKSSKSVKTSRQPYKTSKRIEPISPKLEEEDKFNKSSISFQSDLSSSIPVSAVNSFMGNSQIVFNHQNNMELLTNNQSLSLSIKGTDADFTVYTGQQAIYHFGSFNGSTSQVMKVDSNDSHSIKLIASNNIFSNCLNRSKGQCVFIDVFQQPKCLIIGGKSTNDQKLQTILEFDINSFQITESVFKISQPKSGFGCATKQNKVYIAGGSNSNKSLKNFQEYRVSPLGFAKIDYPSMNHSRDELGMVIGYDGYIYACGGINQLGTVLPTFERYNWEKSKWQMMPSMKSPRRCFSMVSMPHGLYAIGGYDGKQYLNEVEFYDFREKKWFSETPMIKARFAHTAVVSSDMQYIIVSGGFNKQPLKSTQILNVLQRKWVLGGELNQQRFLHCSVLINS